MFKNLKNKINAIRKKTYTFFMSNFFNGETTIYSKGDYLNQYELFLYLNKAINKRAEKVGQVKFQVKDKDGEIVENEKLEALLYKPNKYFNGQQFWNLYQKYYDLIGEVYIRKIYGNPDIGSLMSRSKLPKELHLLRPDLVKHVYDDETDEILAFEYNMDNKIQTFTANEVIYFRNPDPKNPLKGQSLLVAGAEIIETGKALEIYQANVIKNGGKVEGVLSFKSQLTKTQLEEIDERYGEKYSEAKKSGKPMILGGDAQYQNLGLNPAELSYLETKNVNLNDICIMTGVPKPILAMYDDIKYDNADSATSVFLEETIRPLLDTLVMGLDADLLPFDGEEITYEDPTPVDHENKMRELEVGFGRGLTINEAREIMDREPVDNGDEVLIPMNLISGTEEKQEIPEQLKPENIEDDKEDDDDDKKKTVNADVKFIHPLQKESNRRKYMDNYLKKFDVRERQMKILLNRYFKEQLKRLLDNLTEVKHFRKKDIIDESFNLSIEIKLAKSAVQAYLLEIIKEQGQETLGFVGYTDYDYVLSGEIKTWLDKRTDLFATSINKTTFKKLKKAFAESLELGETRAQLIKRIEKVYGDKLKTKGQAETIARTEIQACNQEAIFTAYQQAQIPIKIWVWSIGVKGGVRENHIAMDGEEKPMNMPFSNGLMKPGDGPPDESVNCQCSI